MDCASLYCRQAGVCSHRDFPENEMQKGIVPYAKSVYTKERNENMEDMETVKERTARHHQEDLERIKGFCLMDDEFMTLYRCRYKVI